MTLKTIGFKHQAMSSKIDDSYTLLSEIIDCIKSNDEIDDKIITFIKTLNLAVISGDYCLFSETENHITENRNKIQELVNNSFEEGITIQTSINKLYTITNELFNSLESLIKICIDQLKGNKTSSSLYDSTIKTFYSPILENTNIIEYLNIFQLNCNIAAIDHCLISNSQFIKKLIKLYNKIKEIKDGTFRDILENKCKILLHKVIIPHYVNNNNHLLFEIDSLPSIYNLIKNIDTIKYYNFFSSDTDLKDLHKKAIAIQNKNPEDYSLEDFYHLTKHIKEDHQDLKRLKDLLEKFKKQYYKNYSDDDKNKLFDHWAWNLAYNFILNNKFSLELNAKNRNLAEIEYSLDKIISIQNDTKIYNYFPYLQYLRKLSEILNKELQKDNIDFNKVEIIINIIKSKEKGLPKLRENYQWCITHNFQIFQKTLESCKTKIEITEEKYCIFLASSHISPINTVSLNKEVLEIESQISSINNLKGIYKKIQNDSFEIIRMRRDIEKHDKNQVQILGIFSALVFVAAGGINIFSKAPSIEYAAKYTLFFSYSIVIMILSIWLITNDYYTYKRSFGVKFWISIALLIVSTIFILLIIFSKTNAGDTFIDSIISFLNNIKFLIQ